MSYWQFKSRNLDLNFKELKDLKEGDVFFTEITENHILKAIGLDSVIFWDRTDKEKGIYLVTKIVAEPYETDELSSAKAIPMKVIKKLDKPFVLEENGFKELHEHLNTTIHKGRVRSRVNIGSIDNISPDTAERLYKKILNKHDEPSLNLKEINKKEIKDTLQLFTDNYKEYVADGKNGYYYNVFMEANIARQEIRHSSFLANLLTFDGNHFQGNLFLTNFLEEIKEYESLKNCEAIKNFDTNNYTVTTEEHNETSEAKGLMDIVVKDGKHAIIIENKTGTKDHNGQLIKYKDFMENVEDYKHLDDYVILYLTPHGELPTDIQAQNDPKIVPISYIEDVKQSMGNSIENISNENLQYIIEQYIKSIELYSFNLAVNWEYEIATINLITQDKNIFEHCEIITRLVNYNIIEEYGIFSKDEISVAEQIAKYFIKSKAQLELSFMSNLSLQLDELLEKKGFSFSKIDSNIFTHADDIGNMIDINLAYNARRNRIKSYNDKKNETYKVNIRDVSQTLIVHEKIINSNESLMILISNDIFGLRLFFYHLKNGEIINNFNETAVPLIDSDEFYSPNINEFLDKEYLSKKINYCIEKIDKSLKVDNKC